MKTFYKVLLPFINKDDMKEYNRNGKVALTPERAKLLREMKVIGEEIATAPPPPETATAAPPPENAEAAAAAENAAAVTKGKLIMPKGGK
ncbi:hypothetical protein R80B4_00963 [Fibrobacteres bacterium R8-0-B4]